MSNDVFYFGCRGETGHYLFGTDHSTRYMHNPPEDFPVVPCGLDAGFLPPKQPQTEGLATFTHINGWTLISFWDRSVDRRPGSNSAFIMRGIHSFEAAVGLAKEAFPEIWNRFTFEVVERKTEG